MSFYIGTQYTPVYDLYTHGNFSIPMGIFRIPTGTMCTPAGAFCIPLSMIGCKITLGDNSL